MKNIGKIGVVLFLVFFFFHIAAADFSIDSNKFKTSPFTDGFLTVYGASGSEKALFGLNFIMNFQQEPILIKAGDSTKKVVDNQFAADVSLFYSIVKWFDVGLSIPIVFFQNGEGWNESDSLTSGGIGDLRLVPRFQLYNFSNDLFSISLITELSAPTGRLIHSVLGSKQFTFKPTIALGTQTHWVDFAANIFYRVLPKQTFVASHFDDEFGLNLALNVHAVQNLLDVIAEFNSATSIVDPFRNKAVDNIEFGGGLRFKTPVDLDVVFGAFGGFGQAIGVPKYRVFAGISWDMNLMPKESEVAKDKLQDENRKIAEKAKTGTPEKPQNGDSQTEKASSPTDLSGEKLEPQSENPKKVPEKKESSSKQIELEKKEAAKEAKPERESAPQTLPAKSPAKLPPHPVKSGERLSTVITFMHESDYIADPVEIEKIAMILIRNFVLNIRIESHIDKREKRIYAQKRADAVKAILIKNGVEAKRIKIKNVGSAEPVSLGDTEPDMVKNRRVEFFIIAN